MKKIRLFIFGLLVLAINFSWAQVTIPHYEAFDYAVNDSLPMHGWVGINSGDQILVTDGNLDYSGLAASVGNKVSFDASGRDFHKLFSSPPTTGVVYMSYLFRVTGLGAMNTSGGYFTGLGGTYSNFGSTTWLKLNDAGFNIGLNARSTAANTIWDPTLFNTNAIIFVVVSYEMISGTTNDIAKMWINPAPSTFGGGSPPTANLTITNNMTDLTQIDRLFLRQDYSTATPFIDLDEIRVATTWALVTPVGSGINEISDISKFQVNPNPSNGELMIRFSPKTSYDVKIYNTLGGIVYSQTNIKSSLGLDLSKFNKGVYFVQLKDNNSSTVASRKIVIQ